MINHIVSDLLRRRSTIRSVDRVPYTIDIVICLSVRPSVRLSLCIPLAVCGRLRLLLLSVNDDVAVVVTLLSVRQQYVTLPPSTRPPVYCIDTLCYVTSRYTARRQTNSRPWPVDANQLTTTVSHQLHSRAGPLGWTNPIRFDSVEIQTTYE